MRNETRYVTMVCSCGSEWIEDRMEPGPTCPVCGHHEPWTAIEDSDAVFVEGPGRFDIPASRLLGLFEAWRFEGFLDRTRRGHIDRGRWAHGQEDGDPAWKIVVDVEVFKDADEVRSVILSYHVDARVVLRTTVPSADRLHDLVAMIGRTWRFPTQVQAA